MLTFAVKLTSSENFDALQLRTQSMLETLGFFARVAGIVLVSAVLLLLVSCRTADADPLADLGVLCVQGNVGACQLYQSATAQQIAQEQLYQQGINTALNYLTSQQYLANQRMQQTPFRPAICTQQGVFTICQ